VLFNSYIFWAFFAVVLAVYRVVPLRAQNRLLLVASYVFYGYWDWRFLSLLLISTVIDYYVARWIAVTPPGKFRKRLVVVSLVANLGMLGVFKYYGFFVTEMIDVLARMGVHVAPPVLHVVLPVGISFYTFQTLSYTIDVYRGHTEPATNLLDFALYVSFFPQLVAGPIERSSRLLPQILAPRVVTPEAVSEGLYHVAMGLFKKVVLADNMAPIVNHVFSRDPSTLSGADVLVGVYAFAFQIYGDFSGYSSIAQGLAKWMGFDLMWNFKMPYFAVSPSDFWRRWHVSLSTWLRDYLYIPLGGNRSGAWLTYRNLALTMVLGGLWHGAGWTFINWGVFHGLILIAYRRADGAAEPAAVPTLGRRAVRLGQIVLMFHLVCVSWLLFRADSMHQVVVMLGRLFAGSSSESMVGFAGYAIGMIAFFAGPLLALELWIERSGDLLKPIHSRPWIQVVLYVYLAVMLLVFTPLVNQVFIYFQF